ncbi:Nucleotidyltransferase domain protein [Pelotomaculum sp. FP]|uniref:nucleotidyltransferase domain-containing protein n=1 Tax=Pelotomaculum sp. FP TaxID=261474 RepID=UPI001065467C|nr:nucleotidyltransferase domain-containing protein [Pelotomaculum sp. FP]TEB15229.1 Nucleotidyltransferase domain protein [Pelotomaculum sp. FP]
MAKKNYEISIRKYLEKLKSKNIRVKKAILFGSLVIGNYNEDSDIDLAIVSPDLGRDRFKESLLLKKITRGIDLDISPRPYSVEQYQKATQGDFLFDEIIQKGKTVYSED